MSRRVAWLGFAIALLGGVALLALGWHGSVQNLDRGSHAAIVRALADATGNTVDPGSLCIAAPEHFPDLVLVRARVADAGCRLEGAFVHGRWQRASAGLLDRLGQEMLAARGWARADAATRRTLAVQWAVEAVYPHQAVLDPAALDPWLRTATMAAPASEALEGGGVMVRLWVIETTVAGPRPARVAFVVGPDGAPGR